MEASHTGNPFVEKNLLVALMGQLARSEELHAGLKASGRDLGIVDEAHKMSAHHYSDEPQRTKRSKLDEMLRATSRHFLLLTAPPDSTIKSKNRL